MNILSNQELETLASVISEVETQTSGELRLMIVERSTPSNHVFRLLWPFVSLPVLLFFLHESWWVLALLLALSTLLAWGLSYLPWVQRLVIPNREMSTAVLTRAEIEFYREGLHKTDGGTGILLFLSLFEHRAVVLGDVGISAKLKNETWDEVVGLIIAGGRSGNWSAQLEKAIRLCGNLLRQHFPIQNGDKNELPNHVIVKK